MELAYRSQEKHKHETNNNNKNVTKQLRNKIPYLTLIIINFTQLFFLKYYILITFSPCVAAALLQNNFQK